MPHRMFSTTPGLYPLDASNTHTHSVVMTKMSGHCQCQGAKLPLAEHLCSRAMQLHQASRISYRPSSKENEHLQLKKIFTNPTRKESTMRASRNSRFRYSIIREHKMAVFCTPEEIKETPENTDKE